jgi:hypothetical protein
VIPEGRTTRRAWLLEELERLKGEEKDASSVGYRGRR